MGTVQRLQTASAVSSVSLNLTANTQHFIVVTTNNNTAVLVGVLIVGSGGAHAFVEMTKGSNTTYDTSVAGKFTISINTARIFNILDFSTGAAVTI